MADPAEQPTDGLTPSRKGWFHKRLFLKYFLILFAGLFVFGFVTRLNENIYAPMHERMLREEFGHRLNIQTGKYELTYSCGDLQNYASYEIDTQTVSQSLSYPRGAAPNFGIEFLDRYDKEILATIGGFTAGAKLSDARKLQLSGGGTAKQLNSKRIQAVVAVIAGSMSGYLLGRSIPDYFELHCYSSANDQWVQDIDWRELTNRLYLIEASAAHVCVSQLSDKLGSRIATVPTSRGIVGSLAQLSAGLRARLVFASDKTFQTRYSSISRFSRMHPLGVLRADHVVRSDDFLIATGAEAECASLIDDELALEQIVAKARQTPGQPVTGRGDSTDDAGSVR